MKHQQPSQNFTLPEKVYKYREWSKVLHQNILINNEIFFSSPKDFKDPHDCKNPVRYDLLVGEQLEQFAIAKTDEHFPNASAHEKAQWRKQAISNLQDKDYQLKMSQETHEQFCDRLGVLCLTEHNNELSMWEKYSDNHTGLCIGFHAKLLFNDPSHFGGGGEVDYVETLPVINPNDEFKCQHYKLVYSKLNTLAFEKEYRVTKFNEQGFTVNQRKVVLPDNVYAEVILGANMSDLHKIEVITMVRARFPHVAIFQATLHQNAITIDLL